MEQEKHKCLNCNEAEFDDAKQLRGHQMKCRPKENIRKKRVPFGAPVKRFNCPTDDKYHYRVFNDNWKKEPGRIKRAQDAGYERVDHEITGMSVGTNDDGSEIKAVLMRIPKEWYDEDQAVKARELDKIDEQIYRGEHGKEKGEKRYLPGGGIKIETTKG